MHLVLMLLLGKREVFMVLLVIRYLLQLSFELGELIVSVGELLVVVLLIRHLLVFMRGELLFKLFELLVLLGGEGLLVVREIVEVWVLVHVVVAVQGERVHIVFVWATAVARHDAEGIEAAALFAVGIAECCDGGDMCGVFFGGCFHGFLGCVLSGLARSAGLQLAGDELEVVWHFDAGFEEEEFEVTGFVFELDLVAVLERFGDGAARPEHGEDLGPVRALDAVEAGHERVLFLGCPWAPLRGESSAPGVGGRFARSSKACAFIQDLSRL